MEASDPTSRTTTMSKRSGEFELVLNLKTAKALGLDVSSPGSPMRSLNKCGEARRRSSGCKSRRHRCYGASGEDNGAIVAPANQWSAPAQGARREA
jgi:hypothetical protein